VTPRADYGGHVPAVSVGGTIGAIAPGSPAQLSGLNAGDVVLEVDGHPVRDVIDWQWLADADAATLTVMRPGSSAEQLAVRRATGEAWGLTFTETVFDGVRTCRNRCSFCFMAQLPKGLRRALYLRDDDYRLSFLQGNFVTLTNLSDADVERITEQHLSPLYVSLHAVDPMVRQELICAREDRALERLDCLLQAGIDAHIQIVLVPGINDAEQLEKSLTWLAEREGVLSVGIVPLGYTAHQHRFPGSYESRDAAAGVITQVEPWQRAFRQRDELTWVYLADEFYLQARAEVPPAAFYDGFPQYENGIGLVRDWLDSVDALRSELTVATSRLTRTVVLVTGTLFAPVLRETIASLAVPAAERVGVLAVENGFFGGNVGVTGLLSAEDLLPAIRATPPGAVVLVPDILVNADGLLLDDVPAAELGMRSGREVRLVSCDAAGLLGGLHEAAADPHGMKE
jgi:putative radical SAM enzyme (TIGR03279 family)